MGPNRKTVGDLRGAGGLASKVVSPRSRAPRRALAVMRSSARAASKREGRGRAAATVHTAGYAGRTVREFISALKSAGIKRLIDVRALPLSRRPGFSKSALAASLDAGGIEYVHLRDAGNPFRHEASDIERCLLRYRHYLEDRPDVLEQISVLTAEMPSILLCVEADPSACHRSVIALALERAGRAAEIVNL